ncbi:MAG: IS21 family transposase [Burkholderiales bacterium]|nr:IS21 family transposase [Burkholderiales bacterium]
MNALKPHLQTTLRTLLAQNVGQREIARVTGIDRKTIRNFQKRLAAEPANSSGAATGPAARTPPPWPPAAVPSLGVTVSLCEPHREFVEAQLRLRRNATAIYQDLVDEFGFDGHYNSVKRFVAKLAQREPEQFDRLEFAPGEEAQVDYGEGALTRVPGTTRYRRPRLFVMTLRYSRRSFRRVLWRSDQQSWARLHEQAWRYFGGACRYVVLDNLKEGVAKPDLYEPELNPVYAATLAHYGVIADPARVGDPNRKGSVENAIGHTQATALKGRRFESIEAHNEFLEHWETKWAAPRIHGNTRRQVQAMFEEERPHLLALPATVMQFFTEQIRTVCDDTCVLVDHSSYAARPARIGTKVLVRIFDRHLEIRDRATKALLRTHVRVERPGTVVLPAAERVFNPSRETRAILARAREIGPAAQRLCELLFAVQGRVGQRKLWGIVGLADRIPRRFVDAACERALADGVHGYKHVKVIAQSLLEHALAALDAGPSQDAERLIQQHPLIRSTQIYAELFERASQAADHLQDTAQ